MWLPGDEIFELEADLEDRAVEHARRRGWYVRKYKNPQRRSAPDRIFIRGGVVLFIEFKRQLKEPTKGQWDEIYALRAVGATVYWIDSIEDFYVVLHHHERLL